MQDILAIMIDWLYSANDYIMCITQPNQEYRSTLHLSSSCIRGQGAMFDIHVYITYNNYPYQLYFDTGMFCILQIYFVLYRYILYYTGIFCILIQVYYTGIRYQLLCRRIMYRAHITQTSEIVQMEDQTSLLPDLMCLYSTVRFRITTELVSIYSVCLPTFIITIIYVLIGSIPQGGRGLAQCRKAQSHLPSAAPFQLATVYVWGANLHQRMGRVCAL